TGVQTCALPISDRAENGCQDLHARHSGPPRHRAGSDIEGGAASGALPHAVFGFGPISSTSRAPFSISSWLNQGLFQGRPFSVADWMYLFSGELFSATISKTSPLPMSSETVSNTGLPMM